MMRRAIVAVGKQDVDPGCLFPLDAALEILGASSDHMLLDCGTATNYRDLRPGDLVDFRMSYGAVLKAFTSEYVSRQYAG
jgi:predicted amino acid racemase